MKKHILNKFNEKIKNAWDRNRDIDYFNIVLESIFTILNIYILYNSINKEVNFKFYIIITLFGISIISNIAFLMLSRYVIVELRTIHDHFFYFIIFLLYGAGIIAMSEFVYADAGLYLNYLFLATVFYKIFDYSNFMLFQSLKSKTFILFILITYIMAISLQDNTYNVALAFILFILGLLDDDFFYNLFGICGKDINKNKLNEDKFLSVLILVDIFLAMLIGKYIVYAILNIKSIRIEDLNMIDKAKYGAPRFFIAAILVSITLYRFNNIIGRTKGFFKARYVDKLDNGKKSSDNE